MKDYKWVIQDSNKRHQLNRIKVQFSQEERLRKIIIRQILLDITNTRLLQRIMAYTAFM